MKDRDLGKDILFGVAVGDALGVPVEFESRATLAQRPVTDLTGFGTYHQPPGTFSDDSSLTFCLAEALTHEFSLTRIADNFVAWLDDNYWTARGSVFDVGIATRRAIGRLRAGCDPALAGGLEATDNGNGSLMRTLPLLLCVRNKPVAERYQLIRQVSSLTHGHIRSVIACFYYLEFARQLASKTDKFAAYQNLRADVPVFLRSLAINPAETALFDRLLRGNVVELPEADIRSSGYVLHTLEASLWCLLTTDNYAAATLKAVNLGEDTDTTAAVTGGLAGLAYGFDNIPPHWMHQLARKDDIHDLANRLRNAYPG